MQRTVTGLALVWILLGAGCSAPKPEPAVASSAAHGVYAESYPVRLAEVVKGVSDGLAQIETATAAFKGYPAALEPETDKKLVAGWFEQADQVGRSSSFIDAIDELRAVQRFHLAEQSTIRQKVAGAVAYQAKQKGCTAELGGSAIAALEKVIDTRMKERTRDANSALRSLERQRHVLGKKTAAALSEQLWDVSLTSYVAHIEIVQHKVTLQKMVAEADTINKTLDAQIAAERTAIASGKPDDKTTKAAEAQIEAYKRAKAGVDSAVAQARSRLETLEADIQAAQKRYREALDALLAALRA